MEGKSYRERDVKADLWRGKERGSGSSAYSQGAGREGKRASIVV
jgi:hypothetical protein